MSNKKLVKIGKPRSFKILEKIDDIIKLQQMKEISGKTVNPKKNKISLKDIVFEMREEMHNGFTQVQKQFAQVNQCLGNMDKRLSTVENTLIDVIKTNNLKTSQNNQNI